MFGLPSEDALRHFADLQERLVVALERMVEIMEYHITEYEEEETEDDA